ncbi:uncharacterized protein KRP23_11553 [Phytophthora ramorum]|uniref:uncharacterized protein n=1 Tax=Phytophthora ramorum TaxID=164328 RepID=UPI0030A5EB81|nr:hypothetical protein KRP23_11553 [Phytophthora ramorum]
MALLSNTEDFLMDESSVLAFLADCEMCSTPKVSTNLTPTTTWSHDTNFICSPKKQPQEKMKSWRQRRKEEILTLREVVKQLSTELEKRKMAAGVLSTLPNSEQTIAPKFVLKARAGHKTEAALMWEKIAGRQSTLRQSSAEENAKLREALTLHLQQAKSLQRSIKRKLREEMVSSSIDLIKQHRLYTRGVTPPLDNQVVFDQLLEGLDDVYQGVDKFFEQEGIHQLPCPGRRKNRPNSKLTRGLLVQFLDNYAVPFDIQETSEAVWDPEKQRRDDDRLLFMQDFNTERNTRLRVVSIMFSMKGMEFRITMRTVVRKYTERDRTVFITRTLIESIYGDLKVSTVETDRMVLKRGDLSTVGPTTVMQTHREAMLLNDLSGVDLIKYPSLEFGLDYWDTKITHYNNCLEDQLIRTTSQ